MNFGMAYWYWKVDNNVTAFKIDVKQYEHYCILLPLLIEDNDVYDDNISCYGLITSNWLELNNFVNIGHSTFHNVSYSNNGVDMSNDDVHVNIDTRDEFVNILL
eukprot:11492996-Ditylum_brightwellii.AAC.1